MYVGNKRKIMKKICDYDSIFSVYMISIIMFIAFPHLVNLKHWSRYGWKNPNFTFGIVLSIISITLYIYNQKYCKEPEVYKCLDCNEVYDERKLKSMVCPNCQSKNLKTLTELYNTNNKPKKFNYKNIFFNILKFIVIAFPIYFIIYLIINELAKLT